MEWLEAFILGLIQGLTEFLPVSSSGHLELGKAILNVEAKETLLFTLVVHGATVLSTIVVFRKDIMNLFSGLFSFNWNDETKYITKIFISMIPVGIVGVFFKDEIKSLFTSNIFLVGSMLILTAALLAFTFYAKQRDKKITFLDAFIIGIAQAIAVLPGVSRSGSTIATALLLGNKKTEAARFSFLMVLIPILGENILEIFGGELAATTSIEFTPLLIGFITAFVSGLLACKLMLNVVKSGKLIYFAAYCLVAGLIAIIFSFI